eukprot:366028-Chlamydomonas_euryale.AAC.4
MADKKGSQLGGVSSLSGLVFTKYTEVKDSGNHKRHHHFHLEDTEGNKHHAATAEDHGDAHYTYLPDKDFASKYGQLPGHSRKDLIIWWANTCATCHAGKCITTVCTCSIHTFQLLARLFDPPWMLHTCTRGMCAHMHVLHACLALHDVAWTAHQHVLKPTHEVTHKSLEMIINTSQRDAGIVKEIKSIGERTPQNPFGTYFVNFRSGYLGPVDQLAQHLRIA